MTRGVEFAIQVPVAGAKNWYLGVELGDDVKMNAMIASAKVRGDLFFGGAVPLNTPDARDVDALAALLVRYCTDAAFKAEVDKL